MIIGEFKDKNKTKAQNLYQDQEKIRKPKMNYIDAPNGMIKASELITNVMRTKLLISN